MDKRGAFVMSLFVIIALASFVSGDQPVIDFMLSKQVFAVGENISVSGSLSWNNGTAIANASVVLRLKQGSAVMANTSVNTSTNGTFLAVLQSSEAGIYTLETIYGNAYASASLTVLNISLDKFYVHSSKYFYSTNEAVVLELTAVELLNGQEVKKSGVEISGNIRRKSNLAIVKTFSCSTDATGTCEASVSGLTSGEYIAEINDFTAFTEFRVLPLEAWLYVKDSEGLKPKKTFSPGETLTLELVLKPQDTSARYTFYAIIKDSDGTTVDTTQRTSLSSGNDFTASLSVFLDTMNYVPGSYHVYAYINGSNNLLLETDFEVREWKLFLKKNDISSGFEAGTLAFPGSTTYFEIYPLDSNNEFISDFASSDFNITLLDMNRSIVGTANATESSVCNFGPCYNFSVTLPEKTGQYLLEVSAIYKGDEQKASQRITVTNKILDALAVDRFGDPKELFSTNEFVYLKLEARNKSESGLSISNVSLVRIIMPNGTLLNYTSGNWSIQLTDSKWAFNSSFNGFAAIKISPPKTEGTYHVYIVADNMTSSAKFKPENMRNAQFLNITSGSLYGVLSSCNFNASERQILQNLTISIDYVKNIYTGKIYELSTDSGCSTDSVYECLVKPANGVWESGEHEIRLSIRDSNNVTSYVYRRFEVEPFYVYVKPITYSIPFTSNLLLNITAYEANEEWWDNHKGIDGIVRIEKIYYLGKEQTDFGFIAEQGYNSTGINTTQVSNGTALSRKLV